MSDTQISDELRTKLGERFNVAHIGNLSIDELETLYKIVSDNVINSGTIPDYRLDIELLDCLFDEIERLESEQPDDTWRQIFTRTGVSLTLIGLIALLTFSAG